jgi:hypothetical protein
MNTLLPIGTMTFGVLKAALGAIPDQTTGDPYAISNIGEPYVEFASSAIARPGDEATVERFVAADMIRNLNAYFVGKSGRIYWRVPLETDVSPVSLVVRVDTNGEDVDPTTGERCVMDHNWVRISAYCRLVRAKAATVVVDAQKAA